MITAFMFLIAIGAASAQSSDQFLIGCAQGSVPDCDAIMNLSPPPFFTTRFRIAPSGAVFSVHVNTSWAPVMARRFYILSKLEYFTKGPFYRVLNVNASTRFVAQWGYRGVAEVDQAWLKLQLSNETSAMSAGPGNAYGTVAMGTNSGPKNANCSVAECSMGFSVELFVNLQDNRAKLDPMDFSPFGFINEEDMRASIEPLYAGYGELSDLCENEGSADPFCFWDSKGAQWKGVNLTSMIANGFSNHTFPKCGIVMSTQLV